MPKVALSRRYSPIVDRGRDYKIFLDGAEAGSISINQTVELNVEPGPHTLQVAAHGWLTSPKRSFESADGETVYFHCRGPWVWPQMLAALIVHNRWVSLREN
jgi:hypothetical protein